MKKSTAVVILLLVCGCAHISSVIRKSGINIDEKKIPYVNWEQKHIREVAVVNGIFDGDTFETDEPGAGDTDGSEDSSSGRIIRLLGVDTPEVAHPEHGKNTGEKGGQEATEFTKKEVNWKKVILVIDPANREGVYGRTLALVFYRDAAGRTRCLNWELLRRGYAKENLWADDMLCKRESWIKMAGISPLKKPGHYLAMGRQCLRERFVEDALDYYRRGIRKYPSAVDIRKDLAGLYQRLAGVEKDSETKKTYSDNSLFHWKKLKGTKYDGLASSRIKEIRIEQSETKQ